MKKKIEVLTHPTLRHPVYASNRMPWRDRETKANILPRARL